MHMFVLMLKLDIGQLLLEVFPNTMPSMPSLAVSTKVPRLKPNNSPAERWVLVSDRFISQNDLSLVLATSKVGARASFAAHTILVGPQNKLKQIVMNQSTRPLRMLLGCWPQREKGRLKRSMSRVATVESIHRHTGESFGPLHIWRW